MKKILLVLFFISISIVSFGQKGVNTFSGSIGAWERCYTRVGGNVDHKIGTVAAIEYQRLFNDYFALRLKGVSGAITNNQQAEIYRHAGISAGVMVTPFGAKMPNFKTGLSLIYVVDNTEYNGNEGRLDLDFRYLYGLELPFRFIILDRPTWFIGIGCDIQWGRYAGLKKYGLYTSNSMITYGFKF